MQVYPNRIPQIYQLVVEMYDILAWEQGYDSGVIVVVDCDYGGYYS